jgi:hypothetical protein
MDCLKHYCIQLDFADRRMRFLDDEHANRKGWGKPFSLTDLGNGCIVVSENLAGAKGLGSLLDTGCNGDGWLTPQLFQQWTNQTTLSASVGTRSPNGVLGGDTYPDIDLQALDPHLILSEGSQIDLNGIGLNLLSRHLVTLDFPKRTLYLERTSIGPLVDEDLKAAAESAAKSAASVLKSMKNKGQLPGWPTNDGALPKGLPFNFHYPESGTFELAKKGDSSLYHYEFTRASKTKSWKLIKAWRTDQNNHTVEEYPVP